jgi:UDP-glucose 4-epimerase
MAACLVTGGAGFIGSHLAEALVAAGHKVRVLDDLSTGRIENLREVEGQVQLIEGSILDTPLLVDSIQDIRWVFHLAALPSVQRSVEDAEATHTVCATGTLKILRAARDAGVRRVIYAASSSAYGGVSGQALPENAPVCPQSPYAVAKLAGEHYCQCFTRLYGLETVCLRFFNVFGPRQRADSPYAAVIPLFIAALAANRPPNIYGDGLQSRDFTFVRDVVQALLKAAEAPGAVGNVYNVGTGERTSLLELVNHINQILGTNIQPLHSIARRGDVRCSQADISRARRDLGYEPSVSLAEGLRSTFEWVPTHASTR